MVSLQRLYKLMNFLKSNLTLCEQQEKAHVAETEQEFALIPLKCRLRFEDREKHKIALKSQEGT